MPVPWRVLVAPHEGWRQVSLRPAWWWAVATQWLLAVAAWLTGRQPAAELLQAAGLVENGGQFSTGGALWGISLLLLLLLATNALLAGVGVVVFLALGQRIAYHKSLSWISYGVLPLTLGLLASRLLFAVVQPLAVDPQHALALLIRPYSMGPASFFPQLFPPLSISWFAASYLDLFGIWSLWLLIIGARVLSGLSSRQTIWLAVLLVLLSLAILTGFWQGSQQLLIRLAT